MKTDAEIQSDIMDEFEWEPSVDPSQIGVTVKNGIVTLTGHVSSYPQKATAERVAKSVSGVKAVADELEIRITRVDEKTDTEIAEAALDALRWDVVVPNDRIKVTVRAGQVTLEGDLDWHYQREAAANAVRMLLGVTSVTNLVKIKTKAKPSEVKGKIEAAFRRSAIVDAARVKVEAHDGIVVLSGKVPTWTEREEAERASWSAPGVSKVENRLVIG